MSDLVKGFFLKTPHENAPEWVKRKVSVNVEQFYEWIKGHENEKGYVNFDLKEATTGHWYLQLDEYKPKQNQEDSSSAETKPESKPFTGYTPPGEKFEDDVPF